jgi:hypothetical protein
MEACVLGSLAIAVFEHSAWLPLVDACPVRLRYAVEVRVLGHLMVPLG